MVKERGGGEGEVKGNGDGDGNGGVGGGLKKEEKVDGTRRMSWRRREVENMKS